MDYVPFGRMARDVLPIAPGNLTEVPLRSFEKLLGFPMRQIQTKISKAQKEREQGIESDLLYHGSYEKRLD